MGQVLRAARYDRALNEKNAIRKHAAYLSVLFTISHGNNIPFIFY